jgi:hypothetical protein
MNKVVRVMGVVGLAPAVGLIAPAAAAAAPAVTHPAKAGAQTGPKTVSLHAVRNTVPDTGCKGLTRKSVNTLPILGASMWLWHTSYSTSQCIGTVAGTTYLFSDTKFRVRVWHNGTLESSKQVAPKGNNSSSASVAFHKRFPDPVKVCDAWKRFGSFGNGLCITVG